MGFATASECRVCIVSIWKATGFPSSLSASRHVFAHTTWQDTSIPTVDSVTCVGKPETDFQVDKPQFEDMPGESGIWKKERKIHETILDLKLLGIVFFCYSAEWSEQENRKKKVCNNLNLKVNFDLIEFSSPSVFDFCIYVYIQTLQE